jgi:hypothetical protein
MIGHKNLGACGAPGPTEGRSRSHDPGKDQDHEGNPRTTLGVDAEFWADTEDTTTIGEGTGSRKAKASGVMRGAFGFAGQGRPWRKQRARPFPMPIASEGNDAPRGITSAASAVVFI